MWWKQILAKYAIIFTIGSFGCFILLVTLGKNLNTPVIIPGDILYKHYDPNFVIYLPFGTSVILGLATCFAVDLYYFFLKYRWHP